MDRKMCPGIRWWVLLHHLTCWGGSKWRRNTPTANRTIICAKWNLYEMNNALCILHGVSLFTSGGAPAPSEEGRRRLWVLARSESYPRDDRVYTINALFTERLTSQLFSLACSTRYTAIFCSKRKKMCYIQICFTKELAREFFCSTKMWIHNVNFITRTWSPPHLCFSLYCVPLTFFSTLYA